MQYKSTNEIESNTTTEMIRLNKDFFNMGYCQSDSWNQGFFGAVPVYAGLTLIGP